MPKYLIEFKKSKAAVLLEYNPDGCLVSYDHSGEWDFTQFKYFFERFPFLLKYLDEWRKMSIEWNLKVEEVLPDLSFDRFWLEYAYKIGNKKRAENLWNKLKDADRIQSLSYLKTYDTHLAMHPGQSKLYPETYLNQRRWEI